VTRRRAYALVAAVCALPRLAIVFYERGAILENMEKSSSIALVYLKTGTFGYLPGHPTAYTQPLYGWFLVVVYWVFGERWWSVGIVQTLVAVATALIVLEIGRRFLPLRYAVLAALIATLQPYLVWHDVHGNREILDQLLGAATFLVALVAGSRRSLALGAALGLVSGVAVLSNARLIVLPVVLAGYLLWRHAGWAATLAVPVLAAVALAPWVVRNKVELGCFAITTDARALWKANNVNTYATLAKGEWIDQVPDIPQRDVRHILPRWRTAEEAGDIYADSGRVINVPECYQESYYEHLVFQFWEHHPGAKLKLAGQATEMLWSPEVGIEGAQTANLDSLRSRVEPLWAVPVYVLALVGLFFVPTAVRALALSFVVYETAAAWVFAGTTRYRVSWDFVLTLLAAAALQRVPWSALRGRRRARAAPP
jgi:4-amino-4-deoxy-L-arabinose transferase-like glycosyltransferase